MYQSLFIRIKLQGLGWGTSAEASEDDYIALREKIAGMVKGDSRFIGPGKTVSINIDGYARPVREMLVSERG